MNFLFIIISNKMFLMMFLMINLMKMNMMIMYWV